MTDNKTVTVVAELDSILDTRISTIAAINPEAVTKVIEGGYFDRWIDEFTGIDVETYHVAYRHRTVETIRSSLMTRAFPMLRKLVARLSSDCFVDPSFSSVNLLVTYAPYRLSADEVKVLETEVLPHYLAGTCTFKVVDLSLQELSPQYCKEQKVVALMLYNCHEWLVLHQKNLTKCPIPQVELCGPALLTKRPSEEEIAEFVAEKLDPIDIAINAYAPVISLRLFDIRDFCFVTPTAPPDHTLPSTVDLIEEATVEEDLVRWVNKPEGSSPIHPG